MRAHNSSWIPLELFVGNRGQMWPLVEDFCSQLAVSINPHKNASIQKRLLWPLINVKGSQSDGDVLLTSFSSITLILRLFLSLMCHNHNFFIYFFSFSAPASTLSPCKTASRSPVRYCSNFTANFLFYGFFSENLLMVFSKEHEFSFKTQAIAVL